MLYILYLFIIHIPAKLLNKWYLWLLEYTFKRPSEQELEEALPAKDPLTNSFICKFCLTDFELQEVRAPFSVFSYHFLICSSCDSHARFVSNYLLLTRLGITSILVPARVPLMG